jgi:hypothetical protein
MTFWANNSGQKGCRVTTLLHAEKTGAAPCWVSSYHAVSLRTYSVSEDKIGMASQDAGCLPPALSQSPHHHSGLNTVTFQIHRPPKVQRQGSTHSHLLSPAKHMNINKHVIWNILTGSSWRCNFSDSCKILGSSSGDYKAQYLGPCRLMTIRGTHCYHLQDPYWLLHQDIPIILYNETPVIAMYKYCIGILIPNLLLFYFLWTIHWLHYGLDYWKIMIWFTLWAENFHLNHSIQICSGVHQPSPIWG